MFDDTIEFETYSLAEELAWREADRLRAEERERNKAPQNIICGNMFEIHQAKKLQRQVNHMRAVMSRGISAINEHKLTERFFPRDFLADEFPDPEELAAYDARDLLAMRLITVSEGFWPRGFVGIEQPPLWANGKSQWPEYLECSLWRQVYDHMYNIKQARNHCAYSLGVDEHLDKPTFAGIRQSYVALLALLDVLSGKTKAAIEDEDAWVEDDLDAWLKGDTWGKDHGFGKITERKEYAQEPPEVEAILLARKEEKDSKYLEYLAFEKVAKLAWANKEPGTEKYDAEFKYVRYAWLEHQGIELDEWVDEYSTDDEDEQLPAMTTGSVSGDSDEEETSEQEKIPVKTSGGILADEMAGSNRGLDAGMTAVLVRTSTPCYTHPRSTRKDLNIIQMM